MSIFCAIFRKWQNVIMKNKQYTNGNENISIFLYWIKNNSIIMQITIILEWLIFILKADPSYLLWGQDGSFLFLFFFLKNASGTMKLKYFKNICLLIKNWNVFLSVDKLIFIFWLNTKKLQLLQFKWSILPSLPLHMNLQIRKCKKF